MAETLGTPLSLFQLVQQLDQHVLLKDYTSAQAVLPKLFAIVESGREGFGGTAIDVTVASETEATIAATALTNWLCDKEYNITQTVFNLMAQYKRAISQIFEISGYRGTSHLINRMGTKNPDGSTTLQPTETLKLLCGLSLNAMNPQIFSLLMKQEPKLAWPLACGFLSEQVVWSGTAEGVRSRILESGDAWQDVPVSAEGVRNMGPAYMGCSYAEADHKHRIKRSMNKIVRRWLLDAGITDVAFEGPYRGVKRRPTLVVMAELYDSTHAMHRCYGPAIRALKDRFKLVYMSLDGTCDPAIAYMFDKIDDTKFLASNPKPYFDKVKSYRPDVIYYPSVGMRSMTVMGSNLRLAPVQVMTYGHPATTHSEFIDYSLVVEGLVGDEQTIADKILYWYAAKRYEHRADAKPLQAIIRENPEIVRIAVPAWSRKITPRFLNVCQQIQQKSKKPVEFYFYPNGVGALFQAFKRRVESMLNAKVFPRTNYNDYLSSLTSCDIFLSSFPFGATNGILDAGPLGLPIVNLKGPEVHALNDSEMVSHMKQPDWLSVDTVDAYVQAVLRLIENDEERVAISRANAAYDYDAGMMVDVDEHCSSFGIAVEAAYRHHAGIQATPQKSWSTVALKKLLENA